MLYCGAKEEAPKGREKAKKPDQCIRQIRAFGREVVEGGPHAVGLRNKNNKGSTTKFGKDAAQNANCGNVLQVQLNQTALDNFGYLGFSRSSRRKKTLKRKSS